MCIRDRPACAGIVQLGTRSYKCSGFIRGSFRMSDRTIISPPGVYSTGMHRYISESTKRRFIGRQPYREEGLYMNESNTYAGYSCKYSDAARQHSVRGTFVHEQVLQQHQRSTAGYRQMNIDQICWQ